MAKLRLMAMPLSRPRPPLLTLISDWPMSAQPPMPLNSPENKFPSPCPTHSLRVLFSFVGSLIVSFVDCFVRSLICRFVRLFVTNQPITMSE